jgi:transcriptional regulator with XRE-family HTH domain
MSADWKDLRSELPTETQARLDEKRRERRLGAALAEMRKAMNASQQDVARGAAMTQNTISKIEHADDVLISSIVRYMHSIGGGVELILKTSDGNATRVDFDPEIYIKSATR